MMAVVSTFTDHPWLSLLCVALLIIAGGLLWQWWTNRKAELDDLYRQLDAQTRRNDRRMPAIGDISGVSAQSYFVDDSPMARLADADPGDTIRLADGTDPTSTTYHPPPPQHRLPPGPLAEALRDQVARAEAAEADLADALAEIARLRPLLEARPDRPMIRPTGPPMDWDALSAALDPVTDAHDDVDSDPTMGMAAVPEHHP